MSSKISAWKYQKLRRMEGKFHPVTFHEGTEGEWRFSSTHSLTIGVG
jgi:hypothetical protein